MSLTEGEMCVPKTEGPDFFTITLMFSDRKWTDKYNDVFIFSYDKRYGFPPSFGNLDFFHLMLPTL